jgi:hypothetical protein
MEIGGHDIVIDKKMALSDVENILKCVNAHWTGAVYHNITSTLPKEFDEKTTLTEENIKKLENEFMIWKSYADFSSGNLENMIHFLYSDKSVTFVVESKSVHKKLVNDLKKVLE